MYHAGVRPARERAIAAFGADIVRKGRTYDESVRHPARDAARDADKNEWIVISDTSYEGYTDIPRDIMQGYTVMVQEVMEQLDERPTHVFVQGGVGGLAAAVCAHLWEAWGPGRPLLLVVEPEKADCLFASATSGSPTPATGDLDTVMAGLSCGEVSLLAWKILSAGADLFLTVPDDGPVIQVAE